MHTQHSHTHTQIFDVCEYHIQTFSMCRQYAHQIFSSGMYYLVGFSVALSIRGIAITLKAYSQLIKCSSVVHVDTIFHVLWIPQPLRRVEQFAERLLFMFLFCYQASACVSNSVNDSHTQIINLRNHQKQTHNKLNVFS